MTTPGNADDGAQPLPGSTAPTALGLLRRLKRTLALRSRGRDAWARLTKTRFGLEIARNWYLDRKYGGYLGGVVWSRHRDQGAHNVQSTDYRELERLFAGIPIAPEDVLVDVGCGKGRVLNYWLSLGRANRIIGVELHAEVARGTAQRLRAYRNVTVLCGDVLDELPREGTLFFAYNPFDAAVMRRFKARLEECFAPRGGVRLVYYNCIHADVFAGDPRWAVRPIPGTREPAVLITKTGPGTGGTP
jgi:SAM-dependent methyltransferase